MIDMGRILATLSLLSAGLAAGAGAQVAPPALDDVLNAVRLSESDADLLRIDGRVNEPLWDRIPPTGGFRQQNPVESEPATERTEVRIVYDDDALYVAVRAFDTRPNQVVARVMQRDRILEADPFGQNGLQDAGDDVFAIMLDPFHDHRNGVVFATNPNGAEFEALITDEGSSINIDWRGVWEVAGTRTPDGWSAEFA
ncbi:MAG: carbohydrate binding family 9 domain-containing protein, partial [Longimicrobiales bacterium]|nr:carbohydrate binding family 9 domain-containing protein [Longimicrobiales bacterium]